MRSKILPALGAGALMAGLVAFGAPLMAQSPGSQSGSGGGSAAGQGTPAKPAMTDPRANPEGRVRPAKGATGKATKGKSKGAKKAGTKPTPRRATTPESQAGSGVGGAGQGTGTMRQPGKDPRANPAAPVPR